LVEVSVRVRDFRPELIEKRGAAAQEVSHPARNVDQLETVEAVALGHDRERTD
jgi:hypothetical protein